MLFEKRKRVAFSLDKSQKWSDRSELLNLTPNDIDSERMVIHINGAKGKKDGISLLSDNLLQLLRQDYKEYRPKKFLFEGQNGGKYSESSVGNILKKSARKAVLEKLLIHTC